MRNVPPEVAVTEMLDATLADLRETLAALRRPAALVDAEERLLAARESRATAWDVYRAAIRERGKHVARSDDRDAPVLLAKAAVEKAEVKITAASQALALRRREYGAEIAAAVELYRAAAAAAVDRGSRILEITAALAAAEHIELPDALSWTPAIQGLMNEAGRAVYRETRRVDGIFNAAARAISARLPKPAKPELSWVGKLSDVIGNVVEDGPIRTKPESTTTSQRILFDPTTGTRPAPAGAFGLAALASSVVRKRK